MKILFLGVLIKRKGVSDLIDAVNILESENAIQKMKFIIGGTGEEEIALKEKVEKYGLKDYFEFIGWVDGEKKIKVLKESHVLILPSYNEGLPIAVLEGISYGMPVIATDVGDMAEAVIDGYNGYLINAGDIYQLANSLKKIMDNITFNTFSLNSKKLAVEKFSDKIYFQQLKSIMHEVIHL